MFEINIPKCIHNYSDHTKDLSEIGTNGYILAFNFTLGRGVQYMDYTYPDGWHAEYTENNYAAFDPTVLLNIAFPSTRRWSEFSIKMTDVRGVFDKARKFNLMYGATSCVKSDKGYSFLSVSRPDRDLTDNEMSYIDAKLKLLSGIVNQEIHLTTREQLAIRLLAKGRSQEEVSKELDVSTSTLKNVLKSVKDKLFADNMNEAIAEAARRNLI